jgi:hypothetical protein
MSAADEQFEIGLGLFGLWLAQQHLGDAENGRERIAQIVPQNRDELFAKLGCLAFLIQCNLRCLFRSHQPPLVLPAFRRIEKRNSDEEQPVFRVPPNEGVCQYSETSARRRDEIEGDFIEESLHAQKRREVGLVEDAAGDVQQIEEALVRAEALIITVIDDGNTMEIMER